MSDPFDTADIIQDTICVPGPDGHTITAGDWTDVQNRVTGLEDITFQPLGAKGTNLYYGPLSTLSGGGVDIYDRYLFADQLTAAPFICSLDMTFNQIGAEIVLAGATGATLRMGIYDVTTSGLPGSLVVDLGEIDVTTTGFKFAAISQVLPRGTYFLAAAANQDIGVRADQSPGMTAWGGHLYTDGTGPISVIRRTLNLSSGFTELPSTFGSVTAAVGVPTFWLRAA